MGKKIPKPKRQFGVRDPIKQLEERENKIKDKINNPPAKDENQQALSQKMRKFMESKAGGPAPKPPTLKKKKKSNSLDIIGIKSQVVRQPRESEESYLKRLKRFKNSRLSEALYAAKYNVRITRNETTGELKINQGGKNEIDELLLAKKLGKRAPKQKDPAAKKAGLAKLKQKKKDRKQKTIEEDPLRQIEVIPFGERVDAPPSLVAPRKADTSKSKNSRSGLLFAELLQGKREGGAEDAKREINFEKLRVERERENIVNLYKELKKKRRMDDRSRGVTKKYEAGSSL